MKKVSSLVLIILFSFQFFSCKNSGTTRIVNAETKKEQDQMIKVQMTGGYSVTDIDQDVIDALSFALNDAKSDLNLKKILSAKTQIVAGINYDITYKLENNQVWNVIVYKNLSGHYTVTRNPQKVQ
jgi:hypothetical protein